MSIKIKYLGHSTFLITTPGDQKVLIDPWVDQNPSCPDADKPIDSLDTMLITHGHFDHMGDAVEIARRLKPAVGCIFEIAQYLESKGVENCQPMNKGGGQQINDLRVIMTDARHSSSLIEDERIYDGGEAAGYVIEFEDKRRIYHAGDTCVFSGMSLIADLYKPDLIMLPIGDLFTMGPYEAARACKLMQAKKVIPMHWGTFPVLTGTPEKFKELAKEHGTQVITVTPGEQITF